MKILFIIIAMLALSSGVTWSQDTTLSPEQFGLEHLSEYLGLQPSDISYRSDYTEPDSLRLKLIADLMDQPLDMINYVASLKNARVKAQPEILAGVLFSDLLGEHQRGRNKAYNPSENELQNNYNLFYTDISLNRLLSKAAIYIDVILPKSIEMSLAQLNDEQKAFLIREMKNIITIQEDLELLSAEELDSLDNIDESHVEAFAGFATLIDKDPIISAGIECLREILLDVNSIRSSLRRGEISKRDFLKGLEYLPDNVSTESYLGKQPGWKIGTFGNDRYEGDFKFILDPGGDDIYDLSYNPANPHGVIIIDLGGDDFYRSETDYTLGSGCLSAGLLLDFGGDDHYTAKSFAVGSGYFGFGLLYDASGNDRYDGDTHVEGAATYGIGLLVDEGGRDVYNAAVYSQGFGFVQGAGMIFDASGSDSYYAGGKYLDILRYDQHYLSLSQGFGYGLRPWMSGGIGAIVDIKGNDNYYSDIFAQGCSYWWSLGLIYDSSGNDNYQSFQYAQGTATHMSLGVLVDDYGSDVYFGKGLMQGCGHDYSCGLILDRHGDDLYTAYDLSQAAGSANGAGVLIDNEGDDRYYSKVFFNTQGYGNPRRDFGSIGLFIDLGGTDQYNGNGRDNYYWQTDSKWGGGMDIELVPPDTTEEGK